MNTNMSLFLILSIVALTIVDSHILYCPCMGRFGNQVDQFLGALRFAKDINRTLVLPPWIDYIHYEVKFHPFDSIFNIDPIREYHDVISMEEFMSATASSVWPVGKRTVFCYDYRNDKRTDCAAKDGSPFGPFWDHFGISFDTSIKHKPLAVGSSLYEWKSRYPKKKYPVLAFTGAPGPFPIESRDIPLQKYLVWTKNVDSAAEDIIRRNLQRPYVAIHLRNNRDFDNVCDLLSGKGMTSLFDSAQCHGYNSKSRVTMEQCSPSNELIVAHVRQVMKKTKARSLYVSTDNNDLSALLQNKLGSLITKYSSSKRLNTPFQVDLAILGRADGAVLNCVSSFSAFARRERDVRGLSTEYFGFTPLREDRKTEL